MGRTDTREGLYRYSAHFNSLAPCGANRETRLGVIDGSAISTHSPRVGRTLRVYKPVQKPVNFNSLAPCGANRLFYVGLARAAKFQLTRPVWGEPRRILLYSDLNLFQLTRPVWGEPLIFVSVTPYTIISTHSPRVGRTVEEYVNIESTSDFNSLAPCGANHQRRSPAK